MVQAPVKPAPAKVGDVEVSPDPACAPPITLRLPEHWDLTDDRMLELGEINEAWRFERSPKGALVISPPPGNLSSRRGGIIFAQVLNWSFDAANGYATPADGGMHLPDGSLLIPDASWISDERLAQIDVEDEGVCSVVPDFVLEVRSRSQEIEDQQDKMERWMANGVRLGWLIDPFNAQVWIYREGQDEPELLERPDTLSGENVMVDLVVDLTHIWPAAED